MVLFLCSHARKSETYPLVDLVRVLAFNDTDEALDFVQQHGLEIVDFTAVGFKRSSFTSPSFCCRSCSCSRLRQSDATVEPSLPPPRRVAHFIEKKVEGKLTLQVRLLLPVDRRNMFRLHTPASHARRIS
jgi:hypothetical protein